MTPAEIRATADAWDECAQGHETFWLTHHKQPLFDTAVHANPYRGEAR